MRHKTLTIMLAILMSMTASVTMAYDALIDGVYYNFTNSYAIVTYKTTSYNSYSGDVVIPETVIYKGNTYSVTKIGGNAFESCSDLTSVVIGTNVKEISDWAFLDCSSLMSISIPRATTTIGQDAFTGCCSVTEIIVDSNNPVYDSRNNCNAIIETSTNTLISGCKTTIIPNDITTIGFAAFSGCTGLVTIDIPESVTSIGRWAFVGCSQLDHIVIPDKVTSIANDAFHSTGLTSVTIGRGVKTIDASAFHSCTNLTEIYALGDSPATLSQKTFDSSHYTNATLYVPAGCVNVYKMRITGKNFTNIQEKSAESITLNHDSYTLEGIGKNVQLEATILPEGANKEVDWKSYNETVCIVSNGLVIATGLGSTIVTATTKYGGLMDYCTITVTDGTPVTDIEADKTDGAVYDLSGRQVTKPTRGIYIKDGKKMIAK